MGPKSNFLFLGDMIYAFLSKLWYFCFKLSVIIILITNRFFSHLLIYYFHLVFLVQIRKLKACQVEQLVTM